MNKHLTSDAKQKDKKRSSCPVACVLDILGDKWTILVIRDLFLGKCTYNEFLKSPETMPTNILADRLKRLHKNKIVKKEKYQDNPARYHYKLTDQGKELWPLLKEIMQWGNKYIEGTFDTTNMQKKSKVNCISSD